MIKIAVAGVTHETNTFSPGVTTMDDFAVQATHEEYVNYHGGNATSMGGVIAGAEEAAVELVCCYHAGAGPSGMVTSDTVEEILSSLVNALPADVDGIVLTLHGAMMAEGIGDVEGELLRRVRQKVGAAMPIAITLDLHANISPLMVELATIVAGFDTYPHVDMHLRAIEATQLLVKTIRGEITPVHALYQPGMLLVPHVMVTEVAGPMADIMARAFELENNPEVVNITVAGGFPYSDTAEAGVAVVVTTNNNPQLAQQYAAELGGMFWDQRMEMQLADIAAEEAVAQAFAEEEGPVVLVEGSDNVGGGGPANATHILRHLVGAPKKTLIYICDPEAAKLAHSLGVGETFEGKIGGKSDNVHGEPVMIKGKIRLLFDGKFSNIGAYMTGHPANLGQTAVIEAGLLTVVLTQYRNMPMDPGHYMRVGLRAEDFHVIVVKAAIAWRTAYGHVVKRIINVDTPGCCSSNLLHLPFDQVRRPIFPLDANAQQRQQ